MGTSESKPLAFQNQRSNSTNTSSNISTANPVLSNRNVRTFPVSTAATVSTSNPQINSATWLLSVANSLPVASSSPVTNSLPGSSSLSSSSSLPSSSSSSGSSSLHGSSSSSGSSSLPVAGSSSLSHDSGRLLQAGHCQHHMITGKNKGKLCDKTAYYSLNDIIYCSAHYNMHRKSPHTISNTNPHAISSVYDRPNFVGTSILISAPAPRQGALQLKRNNEPKFAKTTTYDEKADAGECKICMVNNINTIFIPCGHTICSDCYIELKKRKKECHICRSEITNVFPVYLS